MATFMSTACVRAYESEIISSFDFREKIIPTVLVNLFKV